MSFQSWWQNKSRRAKVITGLAVFLILEIGLCFATPAGVSWSDQVLGTHLNHQYDALGYMMVEALLACVVFVILTGAVFLYHPRGAEPEAISQASAEDQTHTGQQWGSKEDRGQR